MSWLDNHDKLMRRRRLYVMLATVLPMLLGLVLALLLGYGIKKTNDKANVCCGANK